MGPSKTDVKGRLSGRTFWDVVHGDIVERHPRIYIVIIILLIILLSALAAYLLLDIARHSSLPPFSNGMSQGLFSGGCSFSIPNNDMLHNTTISRDMALAQNSTGPQEMIPSQDITTSPNSSIKSPFLLTLQGSAAVLAAGIDSLTNATVQVWSSLGSDGTISRISGPAKALQESIRQWPSSINSWASPSLTPLLKFLGDNARGIGDNARGVPLPRANFSFKFPSLIAH
jgi:hypothetical protein